MADWTVARRGVDSSGRAILATGYMWSWWERVCGDLGFTPTIVQGAFMAQAGGGAAASAGYHDAGGCFDLRTWDRTQNEVDKVIRTLRAFGAGAWVRDQRHGMDPHIHFVLGTDKPLATGASAQWVAYLNGRDGLAGNGPDYHWRPDPLVRTPPEEDYMASDDAAKKLEKIIAQGEAAKRRDVALRKMLKSTADMVEAVAESQDDEAIKRRITKSRVDILAAIEALDAEE